MTHYMCSIELGVEADDPGEAALQMWESAKRWSHSGYLPVVEVFDVDKGTTFTVDLEVVDVTLEACVCGECTECPDGWHYGADLPCSCTPDCVDAVDPDDPEGPLLDENGAKQA